MLAGGILLGGFVLASFFRRPVPSSELLAASPDCSVAQDVFGPNATAAGATRFSASVDAGVIPQPVDFPEPPPLAETFPSQSEVASAHWQGEVPPALPVPARLEETVRVHRIVDGDSLPLLAERYLGDHRRAREIFEANRDLLNDPEALPIRTEIRIPLGWSFAERSPNSGK